MKENFQYQKGLTLIEILASIVLLTVILTSVIGFFTQSSLFAKKNEQKLGTLQTAQMVVNTIEESVTKDKLKQVLKNDAGQAIYPSPIIDSNGIVISNCETPNTFKFKNKTELAALLKTQKINHIAYDVSAVVTNDTSRNLVQFKVIVTALNPPSSSVTYTYIKK